MEIKLLLNLTLKKNNKNKLVKKKKISFKKKKKENILNMKYLLNVTA